MDKGVRFLSNLNIILAIVLLAIVLVIGNTLGLLHSIGNTFISYGKEILPLSNWIGRDDSTWFHGWTIFYWAWWISWSPFVGMFMARISKGRTIREFFLAVFIVPSIFIGIWFGIIGGTGIDLVESNSGELANGISSVSLALFQMYGELPMSGFLSALSIVLLVIFFVTSADSGAIVIDSIASGGKVDTLVRQRVFWASMIALIAIGLLVGGGSQALQALQAGVVTTGLPFAVILIILCYSLLKGLMSEMK
nr:BCCT family transporter [Marinomonas sp. KJ51-3]